MATETLTETHCYHCGSDLLNPVFEPLEKGAVDTGKAFCCIGCLSVYQVLSQSNMCSYYAYNDTPGQAQIKNPQRYEYLDEPSIVSKLIDYTDDNITTVTFYIPSIHCSSCIWLLEHLYKIDPAIIYSRTDFLKKQIAISFRHNDLTFRNLVELLGSVGYEPLISLQDVLKKEKSTDNRDLIKKIAVAGFCMGNVMLLSFPEYFGLSSFEQQFKTLFGMLNLAFAIPVTFYAGRGFFTSAWAGLNQKVINLDAPLALIIAVLFLRSVFEIVTASGPGFIDTLTGLVFLLLMGRWIKLRTYHHLSFDRDYRSYFPVAVTVLRGIKEKSLPIEELSVGDRIFVRNNEIIPADAILMKGDGYVDFSFVTGESIPVRKVLGEIIYAGGRQTGHGIELEVIKPVSQSYLTALWNNETFNQPDNKLKNFNDQIAKYFSLITFILAIAATSFWLYSSDADKAWNAFTAVLIVACPCVLALSTPFTLSTVLGIFDKNRFYLKNTDVVEQLARIDTIVFDKTGTITSGSEMNLSFSGNLTAEERAMVSSLCNNSNHPLSREINKWLNISNSHETLSFEELPGLGISGNVMGQGLRLGNSAFVQSAQADLKDSSIVHLEIDGKYKGFFKSEQQWRSGLSNLFQTLAKKFKIHLLSGDIQPQAESLGNISEYAEQMHFKQSPHNKLDYIKSLQQDGSKVMMVGDGLNDAGALKQSDLGVAVTDNTNNFNPACDAILNGASLSALPNFIAQAKYATITIRLSLIISASYNLIGVYFAVQGVLSPLTAAILMPLSTITIILFTTLTTRYFARKNKLS
jgi:Cu+-exporting ATPase